MGVKGLNIHTKSMQLGIFLQFLFTKMMHSRRRIRINCDTKKSTLNVYVTSHTTERGFISLITLWTANKRFYWKIPHSSYRSKTEVKKYSFLYQSTFDDDKYTIQHNTLQCESKKRDKPRLPWKNDPYDSKLCYWECWMVNLFRHLDLIPAHLPWPNSF